MFFFKHNFNFYYKKKILQIFFVIKIYKKMKEKKDATKYPLFLFYFKNTCLDPNLKIEVLNTWSKKYYLIVKLINNILKLE